MLDAAERLLAQGDASFSMRELAQEAGVSFATPFNQFGSKGAIMLALSERRIAAMRLRLSETASPDAAAARVLAAVEIATAVMLERPAVNRAVMGAIGAPAETPGDVFSQSALLWREALGSGEGLAPDMRATALKTLPVLLAVAFRGALSFWTVGETSNDALEPRARAAAAGALLGFVHEDDRAKMILRIEADLI
ncbi:TetR/AcrR family transcriptional regulator [Chenggangzhangella methanolivorans]|uniref:TetR/AcrR family transcriptional regulator n=1 Tax=Chenggangzhangella methanolivorans TaxID=1437009 RepID=UPI0021BD242B|nr:helix-turn-helix domain-containing protein [Chenggangzhangella methanolivorans]